jgi:hypothetical protein
MQAEGGNPSGSAAVSTEATHPSGAAATQTEATQTRGAAATHTEATQTGGAAITRAGGMNPGGPWEATVTLRDGFAGGDTAIATGADLVLLQTMRADEAELIGTALSLGDVARLLTRMQPGMVGIISHQAVRWATLSPTDIEKVLIGDPARSASER